jgi:hypothetical protein
MSLHQSQRSAGTSRKNGPISPALNPVRRHPADPRLFLLLIPSGSLAVRSRCNPHETGAGDGGQYSSKLRPQVSQEFAMNAGATLSNANRPT